MQVQGVRADSIWGFTTSALPGPLSDHFAAEKSSSPLLLILRERGMLYRWRFPFCLAATAVGQAVLLRGPVDLHKFCEDLRIPISDLPEW